MFPRDIYSQNHLLKSVDVVDLFNTRRLTSADRSRASASFGVDPANIFLTSSLITRQNLVVVSHTVRAHVEGPKNVADAGSPLGREPG